jgi:hypothetical protein
MARAASAGCSTRWRSAACRRFSSAAFNGAARNELISRATVVLNINLYPHTRIFEIVRVSYVLANRKAVVADLDIDTSLEDDIRPVVKFAATLQQLVASCESLANNDRERGKLEELGFSCISRRDIRDILKNALASP